MAKISRAQMLGKYIVKHKATIRQTGQYFSIPKSTVHLDVSKKLAKENYALFRKVKKILNQNWDEKHLRGGLATKRIWLKKKA